LHNQRVRQFGEVFTAEREVSAMLDLVQSEIERIESLFLEPACGTGNFLAEILKRKLKFTRCENDVLAVVRSLYGIELLQDNVQICRARLLAIVKNYISDEQLRQAENIIQKNIVCGNALDGQTIFFSDWNTGEVHSLSELMNESSN